MKPYTICIDTRPIVTLSADGDSAAGDSMEINSALGTWLGEDLRTMNYEGERLGARHTNPTGFAPEIPMRFVPERLACDVGGLRLPWGLSTALRG